MAPDSSRRPIHVVIYGPPAAGKLTVAKVLAENHGLKLLDNHASTDLALRLFDFGTDELHHLVMAIRIALFSAAAAAGIDIVSTFVFADPEDREFVDQIVDASNQAGALVRFVRLCPDLAVLEQRITDRSRAGSKKIQDLSLFRAFMARYDVLRPINEGDLSIDNGCASAEEVARRIANELGLDRHVS